MTDGSSADSSLPDPDSTDGTPPDLGTTFDVLCARRRRYCCYHLSTADDGSTTVDELGSAVATLEADVGGDPDFDPAAVVVSLRHSHLPKLAAAGFVAYDRSDSNATVTYRRRPVVDEWVDRARRQELDGDDG